jgi:hypothetical protein
MSGFRSQNEVHLLSTDCLLLAADCLLYLRRAGQRGLLAGRAVLDNMSPPTGKERARNFKKLGTGAGMSMKTKDRPSEDWT